MPTTSMIDINVIRSNLKYPPSLWQLFMKIDCHTKAKIPSSICIYIFIPSIPRAKVSIDVFVI